jgi:hypothetical protein
MALKFLRYSIFLFIVMVSSTCSKIVNDGIPSYIYIDTIGLESDILTQGYCSIHAPVVWVDAGGVDMGAWELPALIPILKDGEMNIIISAGVKKAAISDFYRSPFYDIFTKKITLTKTKIDTVIPIVKYSPRTSFLFNEDFESTLKFNNINTANEHAPIFGAKAGVLYTSDLQKVTQTNNYIEISDSTKEMYLEFDYKTNIDTAMMFVNLRFEGDNVSTIVGLIRAGTSWKRAYYPIHEYVNTRIKKYKLEFAIFLPDGKNSSTIFLDNIKVVDRK